MPGTKLDLNVEVLQDVWLIGLAIKCVCEREEREREHEHAYGHRASVFSIQSDSLN